MEPARLGPLRRDLAHAVRMGPFSATLHLAIEASGLTLEQVRLELAARGAFVSMATLSYWRRGLSRPERPESLLAVALLEEILGLSTGALSGQLGPRRPRGRTAVRRESGLDVVDAWDARGEYEDLLQGLDPAGRLEITRVSTQDRYSLGADRREVALTTSQVLRAEADDLGRMTVLYRTYDPPSPSPVLTALHGCRVGRVRIAKDSGFVAAELLFDRVLRRGETAVVDYELTGLSPSPPTETDFYQRFFPYATALYVLSVQFDPATVPARCVRYERRTETAPDQGVREVWVGATGQAHVMATDVPPGVVGLRWDWGAGLHGAPSIRRGDSPER
ncbi:hypothetical protein ABIA35_000081 [Catenulispora sp. MAP12-49]|uniref:hypothetical protein n=1 Tax=unclassified Catenulispora TaxID=414885 RepID=UPI003512D38B